MTASIDAHQHFWQLARGDYGWLTPELKPIYRDFMPEDLRPLLDACGIDATIAVQAAPTVAETEFLLSLAARHSWIAGVVGWADLEAADAAEAITALAQTQPKLVGLRPMIQDIPDQEWMLQDRLAPALAAMAANDLTFDALVLPRHLPVLSEFLQRYPNVRVIIDHGAKPQIRDHDFEPWASQMQDLASRYPGVYCKLSGLATEARPEQVKAEDLRPYAGHLLQAFGPDRLIFGSDWPVVRCATDYQKWFEAVGGYTRALSAGEKAAVMGGNAAKAYPRLVLEQRR
ncbi:MAG: amidohydrolase [Alphaproteobacteria bacterium TMED89]|nr:amidohydrolase [Rhodospirillaceae bacterium]RPH12311.1 MAG: amidohydrolase [Alphaproteobacteria bacterium TMED89]